jgi:hypothetical protein
MQHRDVGVSPLFPTDKNPPEPVHPAMRAFDDPAACLAASGPLDRLGVPATTGDVAGEPELVNEVIDLGVIVASCSGRALTSG